MTQGSRPVWLVNIISQRGDWLSLVYLTHAKTSPFLNGLLQKRFLKVPEFVPAGHLRTAVLLKYRPHHKSNNNCEKYTQDMICHRSYVRRLKSRQLVPQNNSNILGVDLLLNILEGVSDKGAKLIKEKSPT